MFEPNAYFISLHHDNNNNYSITVTESDSRLDFCSNAEELFKIACDCQNADNEKHLLICGKNTITTIGEIYVFIL